MEAIQEVKYLANRLSYYFAEINAIHPFREGNGRTQRLFFQLLCDKLGYDLDFMKVTEEEMLEASDRSFNFQYELLEKIMGNALKKRMVV